mmetsp:Transcript_9484/g.21189  ORF Transcript_9484/g.21189 Transcript_9484/m.21189 type:complete len:351 (-) Transcript_9484:169-1221(-)
MDLASSILPRTSSDTPKGGSGLMSAAPQKQNSFRSELGRSPISFNTPLMCFSGSLCNPGSPVFILAVATTSILSYVFVFEANSTHRSNSGAILSALSIVSCVTSSLDSFTRAQSILTGVHSPMSCSKSAPPLTFAATPNGESKNRSSANPSTASSPSGSCALLHLPMRATISVHGPTIRHLDRPTTQKSTAVGASPPGPTPPQLDVSGESTSTYSIRATTPFRRTLRARASTLTITNSPPRPRSRSILPKIGSEVRPDRRCLGSSWSNATAGRWAVPDWDALASRSSDDRTERTRRCKPASKAWEADSSLSVRSVILCDSSLIIPSSGEESFSLSLAVAGRGPRCCARGK